jgi:hypothetical protein
MFFQTPAPPKHKGRLKIPLLSEICNGIHCESYRSAFEKRWICYKSVNIVEEYVTIVARGWSMLRSSMVEHVGPDLHS